MPRKDLHVTLDGVAVKPGLALGSWAAFSQHGNEAMVVGDLVLTEDEIAPVLVKLQSAGVHESALTYSAKPRTHFWANDDAVKLARALRAGLDQTKAAK